MCELCKQKKENAEFHHCEEVYIVEPVSVKRYN